MKNKLIKKIEPEYLICTIKKRHQYSIKKPKTRSIITNNFKSKVFSLKNKKTINENFNYRNINYITKPNAPPDNTYITIDTLTDKKTYRTIRLSETCVKLLETKIKHRMLFAFLDYLINEELYLKKYKHEHYLIKQKLNKNQEQKKDLHTIANIIKKYTKHKNSKVFEFELKEYVLFKGKWENMMKLFVDVIVK